MGDRAAFAVLVERHRERAVAAARALSNDPALAEDVAQEAIYQAFFEIASLRQPQRFGAWLCGIAVNLAKMALRRQRFAVSWDDLAGGRYMGPLTELEATDPAWQIEVRELQERVQHALELLTTEMRAAVWLHYVEGLTYQEVSAITDIPAGRLRVLSHRARQRLRQSLAEDRPSRPERRRQMVEVKLHDVRVMARPDEAGPPEPRPFLSWVVFLKARDDDRALAVWVGPAEGESLAWRLGDLTPPPRPQTYALMASLLEGLGATVERVTITDLVDDTFLSTLTLRMDARSLDFDARPSDAINLAQRMNAPIHVDDALMTKFAFPIGDDIVQSLKTRAGEPGMAQSRATWAALPELAEVDFVSGVDFAKESYQRRQESFRLWRERARSRADSDQEQSE